MISFVEHYNEQNDSNLICTTTGKMSEMAIAEKDDADYIVLLDKTTHYFMMWMFLFAVLRQLNSVLTCLDTKI